MADFKISSAKTGRNEGGYVNNPNDPGGETNWGITIKVARAAGYAGEMKGMTHDQAQAILKKLYWDVMLLDNVRSQDVADEMYDTGINQGTGTAIVFLQKACNAINYLPTKNGAVARKVHDDLLLDGAMGNKTVAVVNHYEELGKTRDLINCLNLFQGERYCDIAARRFESRSFLLGWFKRVEFLEYRNPA